MTPAMTLLREEASSVGYSGDGALSGPPEDRRQVQANYLPSAAAVYLAWREKVDMGWVGIRATRLGVPESIEMTTRAGERLTLTGITWGDRSPSAAILAAIICDLGPASDLAQAIEHVAGRDEAQWMLASSIRFQA